MILLTSASLYSEIAQSGFTTGVTSSLATLSLVVLTAWYAYSTSQLIDVNQQQTEAARASFMPALDVEYEEIEDNKLHLTIRNRGQGVARNVSILFSVVGRRFDTCQINLSESLPPGSEYSMNGDEGIVFEPTFYTEFTDLEILDVLKNPDEIELSKDLRTKRLETDAPVSNLKEEVSKLGKEIGYDSKLPANTGSFYEIIEIHGKNRVDDYMPAVYLQVTFNDVLYGERHVETVLDGEYPHPEDPSLNTLIAGSHIIESKILKRKKSLVKYMDQ